MLVTFEEYNYRISIESNLNIIPYETQRLNQNKILQLIDSVNIFETTLDAPNFWRNELTSTPDRKLSTTGKGPTCERFSGVMKLLN